MSQSDDVLKSSPPSGATTRLSQEKQFWETVGLVHGAWFWFASMYWAVASAEKQAWLNHVSQHTLLCAFVDLQVLQLDLTKQGWREDHVLPFCADTWVSPVSQPTLKSLRWC